MLDKLTKIAVMTAAGATTLTALLIIGHIASAEIQYFTWALARQLCALVVIGVGVFSFQQLRRTARTTQFSSQILLVGAMLILFIGAFGIAWSIHLGETIGDYEYWAIMLNMMLVGQGALTIWHLWRKIYVLVSLA